MTTTEPDASAWREPMAADRLIFILQSLARIAASDADLDFATTMTAFQAGENLADRLGLSAAEAEQIAEVVRASIEGELGCQRLWRDNSLFINNYLYKIRSSSAGSAASTHALLPELFIRAARFVEVGLRGGIAHQLNPAAPEPAAERQRHGPDQGSGAPSHHAPGNDLPAPGDRPGAGSHHAEPRMKESRP